MYHFFLKKLVYTKSFVYICLRNYSYLSYEEKEKIPQANRGRVGDPSGFVGVWSFHSPVCE